MRLGAEILEVSIAHQTDAVVFARLNKGGAERIDMRWLKPEKGRWLNHGNDELGTLEEARRKFASARAHQDAKSQLFSRAPVANPQAYLRPFVEFLRREAADPQPFLRQALAQHRVVILGEVHHRPRYWAFDSSLVHDQAFAQRAGVIYLELRSNDQALVEGTRLLSALLDSCPMSSAPASV